MKLLKFTLISILGLSLCTACGGDGDGGETPGPGKPEGPDKSSTTGIDRFDASNIFSRNTYLPDNTAMHHNVYHNNPLDFRYLMAWPITYMLNAPFVFFMNWAIAALGRYERRRLEKQLDDLENEE